jgi:hypothetical protein
MKPRARPTSNGMCLVRTTGKNDRKFTTSVMQSQIAAHMRYL